MHLLDATKRWRPESLLVFEPEAAVTLFGKDPQDTLAKVGHLVINLCTDWNRMYSQKVIFFKFFVILQYYKNFVHNLKLLYIYSRTYLIGLIKQIMYRWPVMKKRSKSNSSSMQVR